MSSLLPVMVIPAVTKCGEYVVPGSISGDESLSGKNIDIANEMLFSEFRPFHPRSFSPTGLPPVRFHQHSPFHSLKVTDIPLKINRCDAKRKKRLNVISSNEKKKD